VPVVASQGWKFSKTYFSCQFISGIIPVLLIVSTVHHENTKVHKTFLKMERLELSEARLTLVNLPLFSEVTVALH